MANPAIDTEQERPRLLIIEDDYASRLFFTDFLTQEGFTVLPLPHGLELAYHLKTFHPNVVLLDLGLPELDGFALLSQIRSTDEWRQLPVVVLSGYSFEIDRDRALILGARHYLIKPVRLKVLAQILKDVIQS